MDKIKIEGLLLRCIIGTHDWERTEKQDVVIDIELEVDLKPAGTADQIEKTVDYRALKKKIMERVEHSQFFLIEALAENIARLCLEDKRVQEVRVRVDKPGALRFAKTVAVEVTRANPSFKP